MACRIVHFGYDECLRLLVLAASGYEVDDCDTSIPKLEAALRKPALAAVALSEDSTNLGEEAVTLARSLTSVPLVLFQGADRKYKPSKFDLVIPPATSPADWLKQIEATIERGRAMIQQSRLPCKRTEDLLRNSAILSVNSRRELDRSQQQRRDVKNLIDGIDQQKEK